MSGIVWRVEPSGVSPITCLKSLGAHHMSPGIWLKLMSFESMTSSPRAEPITNTFNSLVIKVSISLGNVLGLSLIPNSDLLPKGS